MTATDFLWLSECITGLFYLFLGFRDENSVTKNIEIASQAFRFFFLRI